MISSPVIILSHIIPQISSLLIVSIALSIPGFIMTETTLSYLGLGIVDPAVSWGSLIKRDISTLSNLKNYPWLLSPVWFLLGVTLTFNFLGDSLRDFYDPYHTVFFRSRRKKQRTEEPEFPMPNSNAGAPEPGKAGALHPSGDPPNASHPSIHIHGAPAPLLNVKDLTVNFSVTQGRRLVSVQAVRGVSFALDRGGILGIVGESGSGKSVSTLAIPGLLPSNAETGGSALYEGTELIGMKAAGLRSYRGKKIGMVFQEPGRSYDPLQNMGNVFWETFRNGSPAISKAEAPPPCPVQARPRLSLSWGIPALPYAVFSAWTGRRRCGRDRRSRGGCRRGS
jgi:hypothetical protein